MRPAALASAASSHRRSSARDAVLVAHVLGVAAVAERLLVAEGEVLHAPDPLEAGERLGVPLPGRRRHLAEQGRGHDRGGVDALARPWRSGGRRAARRARRRGACATRPGRVRRPRTGRRPGRWRSTRSAPVSRASASARSMAPGSSGLGKATVGNSGSGSSCSATTWGAAKPAVSRTCWAEVAADPVHRGVDDGEVARAVVGETGDGVEVAVDDRLVQHRARAAARDVGDRAHGGDPGRDLAVGRRHDLAPVAQVDLVAVVLRRVVAGGDHDAGHRAELTDAVGEQRRGQRPRQQRAR